MDENEPPQWLLEAFETAMHVVQKDYDGCHQTPKTINNGMCREFVREVLNHFGGSHPELKVHSIGYKHTWVEYNGRHFDAETIHHGVENPKKFPVLKRANVNIDEMEIQNGFPWDSENS